MIEMKNIKYIIHPGFVVSKNDGDDHYISGKRLIKLYGLNPKECIIFDCNKLYFGIDNKSYINLYPRYKGDYIDYILSVNLLKLEKYREANK